MPFPDRRIQIKEINLEKPLVVVKFFDALVCEFFLLANPVGFFAVGYFLISDIGLLLVFWFLLFIVLGIVRVFEVSPLLL